MEETNQQPQSPPPVNSTPPAVNSDKSKVIPIIFGIVAAIVIAIGAYLLGTKQSQTPVQNIVQSTPTSSPTPTDETANWKRYVSKEYMLEMKYPNNLSVSFSTNNGIVFEDANNPNNGRFIIKLVNKKFEEAIKNISPNEVKYTQVNGKEAVYYSFGDHNQFNSNYKINVNTDQTLEVSMISTEIGSLSLEEQSKVFDQILSTFKFTSP